MNESGTTELARPGRLALTAQAGKRIKVEHAGETAIVEVLEITTRRVRLRFTAPRTFNVQREDRHLNRQPDRNGGPRCPCGIAPEEH